MSKQEIDNYLKKLPEPQRATLTEMRSRILEIVPAAHQVISYAIPAFEVDGQIVAGFAAAKNHCGYYPFAGEPIEALSNELVAYRTSKGAIQFSLEKPLPKQLIRKLIRYRLRMVEREKKKKIDDLEAQWRAIGLAAPARRALVDAKLFKVSDLRKIRLSELEELHGMGKSAIARIKVIMQAKKIKFRSE